MIRHWLLAVSIALIAGCGSSGHDPAAWRALPHDPGPLNLPAAAVETGCPRTPAPGDGRPWTVALPGGLTPINAPLPLTEARLRTMKL